MAKVPTGSKRTQSPVEQERTKCKRLELESKEENEGHQKVMCQRFSNTAPGVLTYIREERGYDCNRRQRIPHT
jgi:hypothetical protein